ncbi:MULTISPECIES: hypothetical protein [unclassified Microbacterium]|uniref:hypothetical protein n=1 Tax=unclassified Microbacterium TaxID=2609290 RepID=UPI00214CA4D7|nr:MULTISPECIES: hypothetical protein [unclassified Microbacterium]MCR2809511.1 hypothetical protein [Microbacterium sp. zg.B185]WIM20645.1 hypothetical protein QNO12_07595 [Microbacterium sp. zg-B185]
MTTTEYEGKHGMPNPTTPQAIVDAYHRAWTSGDVDRALDHVSDSLICELFTVEGDQITDIRLSFDRLGYLPHGG